MYVQWFVKGIAGRRDSGSGLAITRQAARDLMLGNEGIRSNWWRSKGRIGPSEVEAVLTDANLDRHIHDYATYGQRSPFISVAAGCIERDALLRRNVVHSAIDTALAFATDDLTRPGALFFGWVLVGLNPAVPLRPVAEAVRELNVYHRWSPYQLEGEVTAKIHIPANQIQQMEWWDPAQRRDGPACQVGNPGFVDPEPITNVRWAF